MICLINNFDRALICIIFKQNHILMIFAFSFVIYLIFGITLVIIALDFVDFQLFTAFIGSLLTIRLIM